VFIEFDENYHFELSAEIIKFLNEQENLQTIVTTHNVSLMSNILFLFEGAVREIQ
jgi:hypothetical protein